jgi:2-hydroxychromene-2-carboxylate isomerase
LLAGEKCPGPRGAEGGIFGDDGDAAGFPGASLVERAATDPDAKAALRANTDAARAVGACGVPTFVVERADALDAPARPPEVFWGQDRFELVMEALCR